MPFADAPSPVAPLASSRLWTLSSSTILAVVIMVVLALAFADLRPWLMTGVAVVIVFALFNGLRQQAMVTEVAGPTQGEVAALAGSQALLSRAFEALMDPVMIVSGGEVDDLAGRRIILANAAARERLKIASDGALLVSIVRDPGVLEAVDEALFGGVAQTTTYASGGSQDRHWKAWTQPLTAQGTARLALLGLRDETDVRRMEMMRVDFLANASHELRTPLASLSGFIETLKGHAREDVVARDRFLDIMAAQAERMTRLVADLLSLSRIELNEHIPPSGRVDVSRAARDVIDAVSVLSRSKGVSVVLNAPDENISIDADRDEIIQVIQNLVDNGIKYSPEGQPVEIRVRFGLGLEAAPGPRIDGLTRMSLVTPDRETGMQYVSVTVRDLGPGMAREHLPRLTERFYRVEGQKSGGERPGTGLGLAIVKHIVNRHRGGLTVESAPGLGSVFGIYLPMDMAKNAASAPTVTAGAAA